MKKVATILIAIGIIYAIAPDPLPGPIDDIVVNAITLSIAWVLRRCETKIVNGADKAVASVKSKVVNNVDNCVANGKMSENTAMSIRDAADTVQHAANEAVASTVSAAGEALESTATKKIAGF